MCTRNLSTPTMQNVSQSGWFYKLPIGLHRCLIVFSILSESKKMFYKNTVYICKEIINCYSFVTCLLIYLFVCLSPQHELYINIRPLYYLYFGPIVKLK